LTVIIHKLDYKNREDLFFGYTGFSLKASNLENLMSNRDNKYHEDISKLKNFKYSIFPVKLLNASFSKEHAEVISFFDKSWSHFFGHATKKSVGNVYALEDLYNEELIGVWYYQDQIFAIHSCSIYGLNCKLANATSYLSRFPEHTIQDIRNKKIETCLSFGNLYRDPELTKQVECLSDIDIASLCGYLVGQIAIDYQVDGIIGTPRYSLGVANKLESLGFQLFERIYLYEIECATIAAKTGDIDMPSEHANLFLAKMLWENHQNYHMQSRSKLTIAA